LFDLEASGGEIATAEGAEITAEESEAAEFGFGIGMRRREGARDGGIAELEIADEFGAHFLEHGLVEVVGESFLGEAEGGAEQLPIVEA
jgi:hypothetical protein